MERLPLFSLVALGFLQASMTFAQATDPGAAPSTGDSSGSTAESATPYSESFSSGEVSPAPPPTVESDDDLNPDRNPDSNALYDPSNDALPDNFRIGVTGALEIPHIVNFGLDSLMMQKYGISINHGSVKRNINGIDVAMVHSDIRFRYHPWGGSFFGGIALGQQTFSGEKSKDITLSDGKTKVSTNVKMQTKSNYVAPHIGWFAIWEPGFTMGLDLGWLVPLSPKTTIDDSFGGLTAGQEDTVRSTAEYAKSKSDLEDSVQSYAKKSLPFMTMIRLGWMF